jgi:hypothetical protein
MRSAESVPLLVKHLHLYLPVRPKGLRDTPGPGDFPAAEALIRIGLPALRPVLEKYAKEAHGPRMLPFWIVEGVLGPRLAGAFVKNVAAEERDPQKKKWLQELADAFGGGS